MNSNSDPKMITSSFQGHIHRVENRRLAYLYLVIQSEISYRGWVIVVGCAFKMCL